MLSIQDVILKRVNRQLGLDTSSTHSLSEALSRAIWLYGDFGLKVRSKSSIRSPTKRLSKQSALQVPVERINRYMTINTFAKLHKYRKSPVKDKQLLEILKNRGKMNRSNLAKLLNTSTKELNYRIRKEQYRWNVLKLNETVWNADQYLEDQVKNSQLELRGLITDVLKKYPFINVYQLEHIIGIDTERLAQPIAQLNLQNKIIRGITRKETPDELFCSDDDSLTVEKYEYPVFVLEKRDLLVELIKMERYFENKNADYWLFVDGLPQAEFDLDKAKDSSYFVKNLTRFNTTTLELQDILDTLVNWGKKEYLDLRIDKIDNPTSKIAIAMTKLLVERGYKLNNNSLLLERKTSTQQKHTGKTPTSDKLTWKEIGPIMNKIHFKYNYEDTADIISKFGQIDDIQSLAYRLGLSPNNVPLNDIVYIPGINFRFGFLTYDLVEDVVRGWPKHEPLKYLDKKILSHIQTPKSTREIVLEIGDSPAKTRQRIRYMEQNRKIRRLLPGSLDFDKCQWVPFNRDLPEISKPVGGKRAMASVGTFLIKLLEVNPPLTGDQISRYLGLTKNQLESLFREFQRSGKIIEGYFFDYSSQIQYTIPDFLDSINTVEEDEDYSAGERVNILPLSDPFAWMNLQPLVVQEPKLQLTKRLQPEVEQWMIAFDGIPCGYLLKMPSDKALTDYELEIKISDSFNTHPVIAGTLQNFVDLHRTWYGDEGIITTINGISASDDKWKDLHFLMDSIGIRR